MLRPLHIVIGCRKQFGNHALDIITDITGFRQGSCIRDRKRHIQQFCQCLHQVSLTASGRSDHQHIGLRDLHLTAFLFRTEHPFVMIVDADRDNFLRMLLSDHIFIQLRFDLMWRRNILHGKFLFLFFCFLFFLHSLFL